MPSIPGQTWRVAALDPVLPQQPKDDVRLQLVVHDRQRDESHPASVKHCGAQCG
jgi:hypothetical protein